MPHQAGNKMFRIIVSSIVSIVSFFLNQSDQQQQAVDLSISTRCPPGSNKKEVVLEAGRKQRAKDG